jgi:hypothetical protein
MAQIVLMVPLGEMPAGGLPGYPIDPGYGVGRPGGGHAGQLPAPGEPGHPSHPIAPGAPGIPDQGLPVPPQVWPQPPFPPLPPDFASKVIVAVHRPGQDWVVKSYPVGPSHPIAPGAPGYPDQGLPGRPEYPSQGPVRPPEYPTTGPVPPSGQHPSQGPGQGMPAPTPQYR